MLKIYVVVVSYNGEKWIRKCLKSICDSKYQLRCVVIDNGSRDDTIQIVEEFSNVHLIKSSKNLGFGKANNLGFRFAMENGADAVFLLNQDAFIFEDTISNLLVAYDSNTLLSPMHFAGDGAHLDYKFLRYITGNENAVRPFHVNFVNAAAWLLPCDLLKKIGYFNPVFDHYGEDENFVQRVLFHGCSIKVIPNAKIVHDRVQKECRRVDYRYLKTYFLVEALDVRKENVYVMTLMYWIKFCLLAFRDIIFFKYKLGAAKLKLVVYFLINRFYLKENYKESKCKGSFICST